MELTKKTPSPEEIKSLIRLIRPVEWRHDFPTDVDIDELFQDPAMAENSRVWLTANGEPCAYAFVHFPYNNLTFESSEVAWSDALEDEVISWAEMVMHRHYGSQITTETLDGSCRVENERMSRFFARHGFVKEEVESLAYELELTMLPPQPFLPEGYTIRPLLPQNELEAVVALHQAAHGTQNFTLEDRLAVMNTTEYLPELDLVVVSSDGELAGNCICGITQADGVPEGYTDPVVVHPRFQRQGLARALIQAGLIGLYHRGVRLVRFGTSSENTAMQKAAIALGFECVSRQAWYSKQFSA